MLFAIPAATATKMTEQRDGSAFLNVTLSPTYDTDATTAAVNDTLAAAGILTNGTPVSATNNDDKTYQVPVSPEAINIMLICKLKNNPKKKGELLIY